MSALHFDSDNCWNRDSRSAATACHLAVPVTAFRPGRPEQTFRGHYYVPCHSIGYFFFYLSLPLLRNKNIFMQVNVSRTSMQMLPLGLSYLLIIFYRLMRQKLPIQLNMPQINLEMHLLSSKTGRKLNTVNILSDRKVSGSFYKTPILTFLSLLSVNPIWDATPQWPLAV